MSTPTGFIPKHEYKRFGDDVFVTEALVEEYHTADEVGRFRKWSIQNTQMLIQGESVYFPADYEKWIELGRPDGGGERP
jgi:hypothetical protein